MYIAYLFVMFTSSVFDKAKSMQRRYVFKFAALRHAPLTRSDVTHPTRLLCI